MGAKISRLAVKMLQSRRPSDGVEKLLAVMHRRKTALLEEAGNYKRVFGETAEWHKLQKAALDTMRAIELVGKHQDVLPTY